MRYLGLSGVLSLCLALAIPAGAQAPAEGAGKQGRTPVMVPGATQFDMRSRVNGRDYRIFMTKPSEAAPPGGYPVLYMLDGNAIFGTAVETARILRAQGPLVVVGIGYPIPGAFDQDRRYYDLTPSTAVEYLKPRKGEKTPEPSGTGGQEEFFRFIQEELKPEVEKQLPIDKSRQTLFGHSLGGLFTLHVLFTHPAAFTNYVAASPSIWWNGRSILKEEGAFTQQIRESSLNTQSLSLVVTVGEFEQRLAPGTDPDRAAFLNQAKMVESAREITDRLSTLPANRLRTVFQEFPGENHGSIIPAAVSRGVRAALLPKQPATGAQNR